MTLPHALIVIAKSVLIFALIAAAVLAVALLLNALGELLEVVILSNLASFTVNMGFMFLVLVFPIIRIKELIQVFSAAKYLYAKERYMLNSEYAITSKGIIRIYTNREDLLTYNRTEIDKIMYTDLSAFKCIVNKNKKIASIGLIIRNARGNTDKPSEIFRQNYELDFIPYICDYEKVRRLLSSKIPEDKSDSTTNEKKLWLKGIKK